MKESQEPRKLSIPVRFFARLAGHSTEVVAALPPSEQSRICALGSTLDSADSDCRPGLLCHGIPIER